MALDRKPIEIRNSLTKDPEHNFPICSNNFTRLKIYLDQLTTDVEKEFSRYENQIVEDRKAIITRIEEVAEMANPTAQNKLSEQIDQQLELIRELIPKKWEQMDYPERFVYLTRNLATLAAYSCGAIIGLAFILHKGGFI